MHAYDVGQGLNIKSSTWFAMGGLGPLTQTVFSFGVFNPTDPKKFNPTPFGLNVFPFYSPKGVGFIFWFYSWEVANSRPLERVTMEAEVETSQK